MYKLQIRDIKKTIQKTNILNGISLEINSGEVVGLLGPNGAGKTTTFYTICGLIKPTSGKVIFDDKDITKLSLHQRANIGIGYLPQESSIFKDLSVEDNLAISAEIMVDDKNLRDARIEELLEIFNIEPIRKRKGVSLSGGERRRVEIARALVSYPKFLLLDEPFAGVDPLAIKDIQNIILQLLDFNIGIIITDHNVRETLKICHRAYVIKTGSVLASGSSKDIIQNKDVKEQYLGEHFKT